MQDSDKADGFALERNSEVSVKVIGTFRPAKFFREAFSGKNPEVHTPSTKPMQCQQLVAALMITPRTE
jgi:hypothetical protein